MDDWDDDIPFPEDKPWKAPTLWEWYFIHVLLLPVAAFAAWHHLWSLAAALTLFVILDVMTSFSHWRDLKKLEP